MPKIYGFQQTVFLTEVFSAQALKYHLLCVYQSHSKTQHQLQILFTLNPHYFNYLYNSLVPNQNFSERRVNKEIPEAPLPYKTYQIQETLIKFELVN